MSTRRPSKYAPLAEQRKYWYERLEREGFVDIEDISGGLKNNSRSGVYFNQGSKEGVSSGHCHKEDRSRKSSALSKIHKAEYFRRAGHFLHDYKFTKARDKQVWEMHSEGASIPEIASKTGLTVYRVREIRSRLNRKMLRLDVKSTS